MAIFYAETSEAFTGRPTPYHAQNATANWLRHFSNSLELEFFGKHGSQQEKADVRRELPIAAKKMTYWQRHPNFNLAEATCKADAIKRRWGK